MKDEVTSAKPLPVTFRAWLKKFSLYLALYGLIIVSAFAALLRPG